MNRRSKTTPTCTSSTSASDIRARRAPSRRRPPSTQATRCAPRYTRSIVGPGFELAQQPGLRQLPVAHHRLGRDLERFRGFFDAQTAEEAHLDYLAFSRVNLRQRDQRVIESDQIAP